MKLTFRTRSVTHTAADGDTEPETRNPTVATPTAPRPSPDATLEECDGGVPQNEQNGEEQDHDVTKNSPEEKEVHKALAAMTGTLGSVDSGAHALQLWVTLEKMLGYPGFMVAFYA